MNILIIKNSPVQTISFILKHLKARYPHSRIHVLAHEHTAAAMAEFPEVHQVLTYRCKDIFSFGKLGPELLEELCRIRIDQVYFYLAESKKNRFDNLLYLGKRLVGFSGAVVGINNNGDEQYFDLVDTLKYFAVQFGVLLPAVPVFLFLLLASPLLYLYSVVEPQIQWLRSRMTKEVDR